MASAKQKTVSKGKGKPTSAKGKTPNSIGNSGEMVGGPPIPPKGKKPTLKIDILLAKAMPGIGMSKKVKPATSKKPVTKSLHVSQTSKGKGC